MDCLSVFAVYGIVADDVRTLIQPEVAVVVVVIVMYVIVMNDFENCVQTITTMTRLLDVTVAAMDASSSGAE